MADAELEETERPALIKTVCDIVLQDKPVKELSSVARAFLWLCHLDNLRQIVNDLQADQSQIDADSQKRISAIHKVLYMPSALQNTILKPWLDRNPSLPSQIQSPMFVRQSASQALERDRCCVVQGTQWTSILEVAHIYPYSMINTVTTEKALIWDYLRIFWPEKDVNAWHYALRSSEYTETLKNMLTMDVLSHRAWDACAFALQPIDQSDDGQVLTLKFFWLRQGNPKALYNSLTITEKPDFPSDLCEGPRAFRLYDQTDNSPVMSGKEITMRTADPEQFPLPSFELLNLQWHLTRIAAMAGGAEFLELLYSSDDDDDDDGDNWLIPSQFKSSHQIIL